MNFKESLQGVVKNVRKVRIESKGGICLDKDCILYCDRPVEGLLELHITKGLTRTVVMEAKQKLLQTVKGDPPTKTTSAFSPFVE